MSELFDKWHEESPFGMFIHWGVYSMTNYHEQYLMRQRADKAEYEKLHNSFNPVEFNADEVVLMAKEAGMDYICFTTKHHDGFCMWDTKVTDYNIMHTPYGKDVLKMLQEACDKYGINLCLYYSIPDWHQENAYNDRSTHQVPKRDTDVPDMEKYKDFVRAQMKELLVNYGKIHTLFWDIPPRYEDTSINDLVRELQPGILINDRGYDMGDFSTPERYVPEGAIFPTPTEANQSVGRQSWSYRTNEDYYSCNLLKRSIDKIMAMGGNYLLNVGPTPEGRIADRPRAMVKEIGDWYKAVQESLKGAKPMLLFGRRPEILTTVKGQNLYVHYSDSLEASGIILDPITIMPESVTVLNDGSTPTVSIDRIPTYYQRPDWDTDYLHIYDLPCDKLSGEPVVIKITFPEGVDIVELFNVEMDNVEARY